MLNLRLLAIVLLAMTAVGCTIGPLPPRPDQDAEPGGATGNNTGTNGDAASAGTGGVGTASTAGTTGAGGVLTAGGSGATGIGGAGGSGGK